MFDTVFENLRKATEASIDVQREMTQKWSQLFIAPNPGAAAAANVTDEIRKQQRRWEELATETLKRQRELVDTHYAAGLKTLEDTFAVGHSASPQEVQERVMELYRKSFDSLRQLSEAHWKEFKAAADHWSQWMAKPG